MNPLKNFEYNKQYFRDVIDPRNINYPTNNLPNYNPPSQQLYIPPKK